MKIRKTTTLALVLVIMISALSVLAAPTAAAETFAADMPTVFPEAFNGYNYSELPYSTVAKDQNPHGTCWAFSAVACAEADAIKNHGANKYSIDLSEWHLAYFAYHGERLGTGDSVSLSGYTPYYSIGGYEMLSALTLSAGIGFVDESVAPYDTLLSYPDAKLDPSVMYESEYRINNVILLDIAKDPDAVKEAIYEYGAVSVNYYSSTDYLNSATYAQYCDNSEMIADHAVTIVGWDDNYQQKNFNRKNKLPRNNGAWLVKNSWGPDFGYDGYFWISYEDATLTGGSVYDVVPADIYDSIYQHDGGITTQYIGITPSDEIVNVFTASGSGDELITAIGISAMDVGTSNEYTLSIYKEPSYNDSDGLTYGRLIYTQQGYLHDGFNTVTLNTPVELLKGETFAISLKSDVGLMVDSDSTDSLAEGAVYNSNASVYAGQTYYKDGDDPWKDAATDSKPWNARIKAYTVDVSARLIPMILNLPEFDSYPQGFPLSKIPLKGGQVIDPKTRKIVDGTWKIEADTDVLRANDTVTLAFIPDNQEIYSTVRVDLPTDSLLEYSDEDETVNDYVEPPIYVPDYDDITDIGGNDDPQKVVYDLNGDGVESDIEKTIGALLDTATDLLSSSDELAMILSIALFVILLLLVIAIILGVCIGTSALAALFVVLIAKAIIGRSDSKRQKGIE